MEAKGNLAGLRSLEARLAEQIRMAASDIRP